jgi:hypothetical protein
MGMMCQAARRRDLTGLGDLGNIEVPLFRSLFNLNSYIIWIKGFHACEKQ